MTHVKAGQRRRAKAPKVRTGCRTCKIRRVKCDEGRPACRRCTSTGRRCDGYGPVLATNTNPAIIPLLPHTHTRQEWRSFQYFHEQTLDQLCTFFPDDFWTSYVLKLANTETSIWHSLIALSSYHELFSTGTMPHSQTEEDYFALRQYNASIQQILGVAQSAQSAHIQLVSCILFICVETLRGQITPVVKLAILGYRILQAEDALDRHILLTDSESSDRRRLFALARSFLSQVVCQIHILIGNLDSNITAIVTNIIESGPSPGPRGYRFTSIHDAHHVLNSMRLHFDQKEHHALASARRNLAAWTIAFEKLRASRGPTHRLAPTERRAMALLELRRTYFEAELNVNLVPGPVDSMLWDTQQDAFVRMLDLAESAMDTGPGEDGFYESSSSSSSSSSSPASLNSAPIITTARATPQFHMNNGAVPIVYGVAHKCRNAAVRQRALHLLASQHRQEGIWSSRMVLGTSMRVVAIEEGALASPPRSCADIPREVRVRRIRVVQREPDKYTIGFELPTRWVWEDADIFLK